VKCSESLLPHLIAIDPRCPHCSRATGISRWPQELASAALHRYLMSPLRSHTPPTPYPRFGKILAEMMSKRKKLVVCLGGSQSICLAGYDRWWYSSSLPLGQLRDGHLKHVMQIHQESSVGSRNCINEVVNGWKGSGQYN